MSTPLTIRELAMRRGDREILRDVHLEIESGEICALMGLSGSGKSTILRAIAALQSFDTGSIVVGDVALRPGPVPRESALKALRQKVGMVFQSAALFDNLTALENITLAPVNALGWTRDRANEVASKLLDELGVAHRADAYPRELSGGEAQRVAIARALAPDPVFLLMDEPTSALDPARRGALGETLRQLAAQGRGLLIATHDIEFVEVYANSVAVLSEGVVVEEGVPSDVLSHPKHAATQALLFGPQSKSGASQSATLSHAAAPKLHGKDH